MTAPGRTDSRPLPIAIVGIGCRFPGGVTDAAGFWELLRDGRDAITEIPADRFEIDRYYDEKPATPGRIMTRYGGFVGAVDGFDAAFFGLSPAQAERTDPQQRLLLETAWEALEDAGLDLAALAATPTGVYIGQWTSDFENRLFADPRRVDFPMTLGSGRYASSGRLSYALGVRGPSLTVDAGCSAGLAAVHLAVRGLRAGDGDVAIAGGVNIIQQPHIHIAYSQSRMMAPDGRCKFGDAAGDGYVRAEGVGLVVLMPLTKAIAEGHRIYAVIRGSAVNSDGDSSGSMGRPAAIGQVELLQWAYRDAGVEPGSVEYVEAHGTGTVAGDPVELSAIAKVLAGDRSGAERLWVGSVKTNIGHTESAAGVAGLIKTALALHHRSIPPSLHCKSPNPAIAWEALAIPTALTPWRHATPLAGVSSFGIAGTNAHVVLEGAPHAAAAVPPSRPAVVLPLSARSQGALGQLARDYLSWIDAHPDSSIDGLCWNAAVRRSSLEYRAAFAAPDRATLRTALEAFVSDHGAASTAAVFTRPRVVFVAPGQGAQWAGMARELLVNEPVFRATFEACDQAARPFLEVSLVEQLQLDADAPGYRGDRIDIVQPTLVALSIAYARWLQSSGVVADAVVGHSLGEVAAAAIAGAIDLDDAMRIVCTRSALLRRVSGSGAMALVELSADALRQRLADSTSVTIAVSNGPRSSVISGEVVAVRGWVEALEREGIFCRLVKVDVASHSPQMDRLAAELRARLSGLRPSAATIPIYSTVTGEVIEGGQLDATYWGRNLREPVLFGKTVERLLAADAAVFVELGPHPVLVPSIEQNAQAADREVTALACGSRDERDALSAPRVIAALWTRGVGIAWRQVMGEMRPSLDLPHYPWQRQRHWIDGLSPASPDAMVQSRPALADSSRQWLFTPTWQDAPLPPGTAVPGHWLIVGGSRSQGLAVALTRRARSVTESPSTEAAAHWIESIASEQRRQIGVVVVGTPGDRDAGYHVIEALRSLQSALADRDAGSARVWWVTTGAQTVRGHGGTAHDADAAAVWGAARVLATEHPDWWGGLVDVEPGGNPRQWDTLAEHLASNLAERREDQVAIRGARRYALRLLPASAPGASYTWRADAAYLITGGFGGLAQQIAAAMVREGARRLVLVSRSPLPPRTAWASIDTHSEAGRRIAAVRALEHAGASVHLMQADIANTAEVSAALDRYRAEGWPRIRGVIHTAVVLENRLTGNMDREAFARVLSPKLAGAQTLDRLLPDLDVFVLFSSISAFWGPAGMANYAAANAAVDAVAERRAAFGRHAVSIQWGPWTNTGLHEAISAAGEDQDMQRAGIGSIDPEPGAAIFSALARYADPVVAVMPIDWSMYRDYRRGRPWPLFAGLAQASPRDGAAVAFADRMAALPIAERRAWLDRLVRATLAQVLKTGTATVDRRRPFGTMGLDSLMALELRNRLEVAIERSLPATLAWNHPTLERLVPYLESLFAAVDPGAQHLAAVGREEPESGALTDDAADLLGDLASVSDDDALRALRGEG